MTVFMLKSLLSEFSNLKSCLILVSSCFFHQVKTYVPVEQIEKELDDIEMNLGRLEREGVELEKKLRSFEDGTFLK